MATLASRRGLPPPVAPPSLLLFHSPPRPLPPPHSGSPVPTKGDPPCPGAPTVVATFHPLTASSPRLSLDFLPDAADFELYDSRFGVVLVAVDDDRPRAWVATHRDGVCSWRALPRSRDVAIEFDPHWP
uniref:Uncharacterized protein n=1 Tax=Oryza nivara TaxID=4536 RepID=A0A0E0I3Z4_ORYNI